MAFKKLYECEFFGSRVYSKTIPHEASCICQESFELHCFNCSFFRCKKDLNNKIYSSLCSHVDNVVDSFGNNSFINCPLSGFELDELQR